MRKSSVFLLFSLFCLATASIPINLGIADDDASNTYHILEPNFANTTTFTGRQLLVASPPVSTLLSKDVQDWIKTTAGAEAYKFCLGLGLENRPTILDSCIMDIRITGSNEIAKEGALIAEEFRSKSKASSSKKYCIASGDPHFVSYDGQYYDLQEPGIYTIVRAGNDFEVQENMIKNVGGVYRGITPSCMNGVAFRYKGVRVEVNVRNYGTILVNGKTTTLTPNKVLLVGGIEMNYGVQSFEWLNAGFKTMAFKATMPNGFSLMIDGGYCSTLEINVPEAYFGKVEGLCGNADSKSTKEDYRNPKGDLLDVKFGTTDWQYSGNNGPTTPMSIWQLSWKAKGVDCLFSTGCETGPAMAKSIIDIKPTQAPTTTPKPIQATTQSPTTTTTQFPTTTPKPTTTTTTVAQTTPKPTTTTTIQATKPTTTTPKPTTTTTTVAQTTPKPTTTIQATKPTTTTTVAQTTPKPTTTIQATKPTATTQVHKPARKLHYGNYTTHCITNVLAVKYDGIGGVYVSGANLNNRVDENVLGCSKGTDGWRKVIQFDPFAISNLVVDSQAFYGGHLDCGGTAYWKAHTPNEEFFQRCSWVDNAPQTVSVMTNVTLYPEHIARIQQNDTNHLLGQWYLLASTPEQITKRDCLILTVFRHDTTYYIKHSRNMGKLVYNIQDKRVLSIDTRNQVYKMESGDVYHYRMTQYKIDGNEYDVLHITNVNNPHEAYLLGDKLYSNLRTLELLHLYRGMRAIDNTCYSD